MCLWLSGGRSGRQDGGWEASIFELFFVRGILEAFYDQVMKNINFSPQGLDFQAFFVHHLESFFVPFWKHFGIIFGAFGRPFEELIFASIF